MCTALITVVPGVSVGSVQAVAASPLRVRAALTAVRSSVMCTAFITVVPATSGLLVKVVVGTLKVAVTVRAAVIVTLQAPVPVQLPPQPANVEPVDADAVRVTTVPVVKEVVQAVPQLMPTGELVTVPLPVPDLVTVSAKDDCTKVAVTVVAALSVTTQVLVPVQPPLQPLNVEPVCGDAVRVTTVPIVNEVVHVVPQLMPAGELVTVPTPAPAFDTVRARDVCTKVAVTVVAAFIVTVQVPVPEQPPPLQPPKVEPVAAAAVRVTIVPFAYDAEHVVPQLMPVGELVTVPLPAPAFETVKVDPVDAPVPVTSLGTVSPSAVKLTLVLATAVLVGVKRTVTVAVAPEPTRVKGLPETMLNGAATEAVPVTVPVRVLVTVKVWLAELPTLTLPKFVVPAGVTPIEGWATALAAAEQELSLPAVSMAVMATL